MVAVQNIAVRHGIDVFRRLALSRTNGLAVFEICKPRKIHGLSVVCRTDQFKDGFVTFSEQHIIAVLNGLRVIHGSVQPSQYDKRMGILPDVTCKLIPPVRIERKDANQYNICIRTSAHLILEIDSLYIKVSATRERVIVASVISPVPGVRIYLS